MSVSAPFNDVVAKLRADPQVTAREYVDAGGRAVGYVGDGIPAALILAARALPVRLRAIPGASTARVEDIVESSFSPLVRIVADQWLSGSLDHLGSVVFARSDDSSQRLYYYLCELQRRGLTRGPRPLLFDVARLPRQASLDHTLDSTRRLAAELGVLTTELDSAMQRVRRREDLLQSVRASQLLSSPLAGSAAWAVAFAASCDWQESFDARARQWLSQSHPLDTPRRVVLAGDPLPDDQMHKTIEECGASVVLELTGSFAPGDTVSGDSFARIAAGFQQQETPVLAMRHHANWLAERARQARADAVVVWLSEEDEALPWEIARQMRALRDARIPSLLLTRQPWQLSQETLSQVMQFIRNPGAHS